MIVGKQILNPFIREDIQRPHAYAPACILQATASKLPALRDRNIAFSGNAAFTGDSSKRTTCRARRILAQAATNTVYGYKRKEQEKTRLSGEEDIGWIAQRTVRGATDDGWLRGYTCMKRAPGAKEKCRRAPACSCQAFAGALAEGFYDRQRARWLEK